MDLKIFTDNIEQEALDQIHTLLSQDAFKDSKVRIMPDVHAGKGCVIGFTADLGKRVVPNLVGVDIGCGVSVYELGNIDIDFEKPIEEYDALKKVGGIGNSKFAQIKDYVILHD